MSTTIDFMSNKNSKNTIEPKVMLFFALSRLLMNYQEETLLPGDIGTMKPDMGGHRQTTDGLTKIWIWFLIFCLLKLGFLTFEVKLKLSVNKSKCLHSAKYSDWSGPMSNHESWPSVEIQPADSSAQCQHSEGSSNKGCFVCVQIIIQCDQFKSVAVPKWGTTWLYCLKLSSVLTIQSLHRFWYK